MSRMQRSLFGEILDWMLAPLVLLWPTSVLLTWLVAQHIAAHPYDRELGRAARALAVQVAAGAGAGAGAPWPAPDAGGPRRLQVRGFRGELVAGDAGLPPPPPDERPPGEMRFRDETLADAALRIAYLWVPAPASAAGGARDAHDALVQVAETRDERSRLAAEIIRGVIVPQLVVLPLAVLLVWLALARGIAPLNEVQQRIRRRDSADLSPLDEGGVPEEVAPLVHSINDLLARLDQTIGTQKRFLADAAHQLKTPLAGLRTQAELAGREIDAGSADLGQLKASLAQIALSSQRAAHMVDQLLAMARAENRDLATRAEAVDLARLAADTVRDFVPRAFERRIDLGYEEPAAAAVVRGHPVLLGEMLRNLVDNALQYTPAGGIVTVRVQAEPEDGTVVVEVEDSGPGIPPSERERVFEPFYRVLGTPVDGSGLGLAIVRETARRHGGEVSVDDAAPREAGNPGARFTLRFPAADAI